MSSSLTHKLLSKARNLVPFLPPKPISPYPSQYQNVLLLSKLPRELRQIIWGIHFGSYMVHMYPQRGELRARVCVERDTANWGRHSILCGQERIPCDFMSLLVTCKETYFECIYDIYRRTSFDFSHGVQSLALIPKRLPATHVSLITQLNPNWELLRPLLLLKKPLGKKEIIWVEIWKALSVMEGLEWLRVELEISAAPWEASQWTGLEWTLWEDVKKVTRPPFFELILPFPAAASTREQTLPCTVIR